MRTKSIVCSVIIAASVTRADIGGGSGKPMTPYRGGEPVTEQRVRDVQKEANEKMMVEGVRLAGKNATKSGYRIRFARAPKFAFSGKDEKGKTRTILLANVRSFRLVEVKKKLIGENQVVIEVTEFPTLTPGELLRSNPTYSALVARKVKLTLPDIALEGTDFWSDDAVHSIAKLSELEPEAEVKLTPFGELIWWAIPSVTADPSYPYRKVMKR